MKLQEVSFKAIVAVHGLLPSKNLISSLHIVLLEAKKKKQKRCTPFCESAVCLIFVEKVLGYDHMFHFKAGVVLKACTCSCGCLKYGVSSLDSSSFPSAILKQKK